MTVLQAIAKMEGFDANSRNIPTRCNNPGDLCAGQFANAHGAVPGAPDPSRPERVEFRYAVFPTVEMGYAALRSLLVAHYSGMTVAHAIARYAPATENDTDAYINAVCKWANVTPMTILTPENIG